MHPAYEVRRRIDGRIHYAVTATTSPRRTPMVPDGYEAVVREVAVGDETWYQHWVAPRPAVDEARRLAIVGLDLHFTMFQDIVEDAIAVGGVEWYKDHEPAEIERAYRSLLAGGGCTVVDFLDTFCRGQWLGNTNHRTAIQVLVVIADWNNEHEGAAEPVDHDDRVLQSFNTCSKSVLENLARPHAPRRTLEAQHRECCERYVEATAWLQSMARASTFEERLARSLSAFGSTASG